jgi:copper chaperone CopZ
MIKNIAALMLGLVVLASSCAGPSSEANNATSADVKIEHKTMDGAEAKTVAKLDITGMTCAAGCGGKIQQELQALEGVVITDLDFQEQRASNIVSVQFDPAKISEKEMIQCVGKIADGMYAVKAVEVVDYKKSDAAGAAASGAGVQSADYGKIFQLLNLLQSISGLIR